MSGYPPRRFNYYDHDYPSWGYIILYLVVITVSVVGNSLFLATIKKNLHFRRTHHFFLASLAFRDLLVTIFVIPFVIDSQAVNKMQWKAGGALCKLYTVLDLGTMFSHAFMLVFLLLFLYFWYRKQESYMTEDGTTVVRKTRMHKWALPLAWVIGMGLAIPGGALSEVWNNSRHGVPFCSVWDGMGSRSTGYKVAISNVFSAFILPIIILVYPFIALLMQLCGGRKPKLDPPHNRNAMTALALVIVFVASRAPVEFHQLSLLLQNQIGVRSGSRAGTPYGHWSFTTDIILNAIVYVACALHPIVYFALNPEYRQGLANMWRNLDCNQSSDDRARRLEDKRLNRRHYPPNGTSAGPIIKNRAPLHLRPNETPLLSAPQPQIMPAGFGQPHYHPYPQGVQYHPQVPQPGTTFLFPQHSLVQEMNNSFERGSPALPAVFEYGGLKYIDTARVEPRIAYSPEKTPPKTPETPHFRHTPFVPPGNTVINPNPVWPTGAQNFEMTEISPIATSEKKEEFQLENMDGSPGNTLRERNRRINSPPTSPIQDDPDDSTRIEILQNSPGSRQRSQDVQQSRTNGAMHRSMSPTSGHENVEIVITGRTRSRQDLCPEVPKSKFEHAV